MEYSELIRDYLDDAYAHLADFDASLMSLEKNGYNREVIQNTLGVLHTFKGNSGMMGYESLKHYIHEVEEIIKKVSDQAVEIGEVLEALFNSANVLRNILQKMGKDPSFHPALDDEIRNLNRHVAGSNNATNLQTVELSSYLGTRTESIKVDFKRLDNLLNLVGELVIYKTRLDQIGVRLRDALDNKAFSNDLNEGLELIGKTTAGLQEGIMKARMLPVGKVFSKFPKMVRDLAKAQGKVIQLEMYGEDIELDKTIIDELGEPLLHIIRNAIDHGIETPDERIKKGKNRKGTINLLATQESNYVIIRIKDDGRGIDFEKAQQTCIEKGLVNADDSAHRDTILNHIFSPGFTTKQEATCISGRGIGLDVVSKRISDLNGQIIVDSTPDKGTTFTIKMPLSLAIIPALMAEAGGEIYAIPMSAVDESIKVGEEDIHIINNHEVIRFREKVLPVIRLCRFFGQEEDMKKRFYLVILGRAEKRIALAVDKLKGQQEIVIKPLDDTFGKSYGIAGASILGDGRIVLIIDIMSFYQKKEVSENV
jgi:two-component system chemotaxis sensor kinase CheA